MKTYTTAQIEERPPEPEHDGCPNCGYDRYVEVEGNFKCSVCGAPYSEDEK